MSGPPLPGGDVGPDGAAEPPRIPPQRSSADGHGAEPRTTPHRDPLQPAGRQPPADLLPTPGPEAAEYDHGTLKSLLGAWALSACPAGEAIAVEAHLTDCAACAEEALRLRDAVGLLRREESLDLDPRLRSRVLAGCLDRRPPRIPVPEWAGPYDAQTARLDALLRDMGGSEWGARVRLRWFDGRRPQTRTATVAEVVGHLTAMDGLVAGALGLPDPLAVPADPAVVARTEAYWRQMAEQSPPAVREPWRTQTHTLVQAAAFAVGRTEDLVVPGAGLPLADAFLDRAFECWVHAADIAEAVDYPHEQPTPAHLRLLVDLAARMLPAALADRRRSGLAAPARTLTAAGAPGRSLHLEIEGAGGGDWYIPLDSPGAVGCEHRTVAHVALDGLEFCQLAAGHVAPDDAAAGAVGDREAVHDVLLATASLSRM
ncbi:MULTISPECIES: zf-HC2 domain-containing protein [Streptomyces]|uniref:zf-HC2 domain-containing protein n=1 Tax=Streptomyces TaxID=1883 RepID=UPI0022492036|nr:maleylpyruvate isomerase N-terminal domain-containing protein [Streptomyces sp. JHD 1]MCX2968271.1 maleylpyruvate isomerase N-terminal domain-containing protein [Streptomyces sp. JHD 1]